ncbi:MAG: hypothetical protein IKP26_07825 [Clostridia bacterium]|nr:hypothetical protein [Clostridia bacterium]
MKRFFIILAACLIGIMHFGTAFAEGADTPAVYFTDQYTVENDGGTRINYNFIKPVDLTVGSADSGEITVDLKVYTYETMEKLGFSNLKVQRWNGTTWVTDREATNQYEYTTDNFAYLHTFTGLYSGALYRVKVTLFARRAIGETQSMTVTSSVINCH